MLQPQDISPRWVAALLASLLLASAACTGASGDGESPEHEDPSVVSQAVGPGALGSPGYTTSWWTFSDSASAQYDSMEQGMIAQSEPPVNTFYFSSTFYFHGQLYEPQPGYGPMGYMGLQTTTSGKKAIFSIWGAAGATSSGVAQPFGGEGTGFQTLIPYNWVAGRLYQFRVTRTSGMGEAGFATTAWSGYVKDMTSGVEREIGRILVPFTFGKLKNQIANFTEYYGEMRPCSQFLAMPSVTVLFVRPTGNHGTVHNDTLPYSQTIQTDRADRPTCDNAASFTKSSTGFGIYAHHRMFGSR